MENSKLLLILQVSCAPEHQGPFNTWYNSHLPNLLRVPGYLWAQRYLGLDDPNRFTALYGVRDWDDLSSLVEWDGPNIHPIAAGEIASWQKLQGLSRVVGNVYEQISGSGLRGPLLLSDRPLMMALADVNPDHETEWDRWYTESHVPGLLKVPGYVLAGRFRAVGHPAVAGFNTGPKYLAVYECESEEVLPALMLGDGMHPEARAELQRWQATGAPHASNVSWGFHKLISKHFKWPQA